jgi:putative membrane protein
MISAYRDHAANARTFLAWVRTGIAVIAFGVVIEKLNLFVLTLTTLKSFDTDYRLQLERLSGPVGRYDGLAFIVIGVAMILLGAARFVRIGRLLDDSETYRIIGARVEFTLSLALALLVSFFSIYVALA